MGLMELGLGAGGAVLLTLAALPQIVRLVATRRAEDFSASYVAISLTGCVLLTLHAVLIADVAFLVVNGCGTGFWLLVTWVKTHGSTRPAAPVADTGTTT